MKIRFSRYAICAFYLLISARSHGQWGIVTTPPATNDTLVICRNYAIHFQADTNGYGAQIDSVRWLMSGANPATATTLSAQNIKYSSSGTYLVRLILYQGATGSEDSLYVNVLPSVTPSIQILNTTSGTFQGITTFSRCASLNVDTFTIVHTTSQPYSKYYLDLGDGTVDSGTAFTTFNKVYSSSGNYNCFLALKSPNGCWDTLKFRIFYGSNPAVGLGTQGNTIGCVGNQGVTMAFDILNTANNPPGTTYTLEVSDGSPPVIFNHPPPAQYIHTFTKGSCGFNVPGGGGNNAFYVRITATNPCDVSVAQISPVRIASSIKAAFNKPDSVCVSRQVTITDQSQKGSIPTNSGCDSTGRILWNISPGTFTVNTGSLGNANNSINPQNWITGSPVLNVTFNQPGIYQVRQVVANSINCDYDTLIKTICVNELADSGFSISTLPACSGDTLQLTNLANLNNFCKNSQVYYEITPATGWSAIDSLRHPNPQVRFTTAGQYLIRQFVYNYCDTTVADTSIVIRGRPGVILPADTVHCGPLTLNFSLPGLQPAEFDSLSPIISRLWTITPAVGWAFTSGTATSAQPSIQFTQSGVYQITYQLQNACGTTTDTMLVTIYDQPSASALSDTLVCYGDDVSFTLQNVTGQAPVQITWASAPPGYSAAGASATFSNLTQSTQFFAYLQDALGCRDTITVFVTVNPQILADAGSGGIICDTSNIQLSGTASGGSGSLQIQWSPATGLNNPNVLNPTVSGITSSTWYKLTVTDSVGCSAIDSVLVVVNPLLTAFAGNDTLVCSGSPFQLQAVATGGAGGYQYNWSPATGLNNPSIPNPLVSGLTAPQQYILTVTDSIGCTARDTIQISLFPAITVDAGLNAETCLGENIQLSGSASGGTGQLSYQWQPDALLQNATTLTPTFVNPQQNQWFYLYVTDSVGCQAVDSVFVLVAPLPPANAGPDTTICKGDIYTLGQPGNPAFQYVWTSIPPGVLASTPQIQAVDTANFTYILQVIDTLTGCVNYDTASVNISLPPVAGFTTSIDSGCSPLTILLSDTGTASPVRRWYAGLAFIGTAATLSYTAANVSHTTDSLIPISLVLVNAQGCRDSVTRFVKIFPRPLASFLPSDTVLCAGDSITVVNQSMGKNPLQFQWSVTGSAAVSNTTSAQPTFYFPNFQGNQDSLYVITLSVTSPDGCVDDTSLTIRVKAQPVASFALSSASSCGGTAISATISNYSASNTYQFSSTPPLTFSLSGNTATFTPPPPTNDSVTYSIRMMLTTPEGCVDSAFAAFTVHPTPTASFVPMPADTCTPATFTFSNLSSTNLPGSPQSDLSFQWNFAGLGTSTAANPSFTFTNSGTSDTSYAITLIASNSFGCSDTVVGQVTVHPLPKAQIQIISNADCAPFTVDTSRIKPVEYPGANGQYIWKVLSTNNTLLATFTGANALQYSLTSPNDTVVIRLIAVSPFGCGTDSVQTLAYTLPNPVASFSLSTHTGCSPLSVQAFDSSSGGIQYQWYVNNLPASNLPNPSFTFQNTQLNDSTIVIKLRVSTLSGCADSLEKTVTVLGRPLANFIPPTGCVGETLQYIGQPTSVRPIATFQWNFGNGDTAATANASYVYTMPGAYAVSFTITDTAGCSHTRTDTVIIRPKPSVNFSVSGGCFTDSICQGISTQLVSQSTLPPLGGIITGYQWDIGNNGIINYTIPGITHTFPDTGLVPVRLRVVSQFGCDSERVKNFYVLPAPIAAFALDTGIICAGQPSPFVTQQSSGFIQSYQWTLYALNAASQPVVITTGNQFFPPTLPTLTGSLTKDTTYYLKLKVSSCCAADSLIRTITVRPQPTAGFQASDTIGCSPKLINFLIDGQTLGQPDYIVINWGDGSPIDTIYPTTIITPQGPITQFGIKNHVFTYNGTNNDTLYTVSMTAVNSCGSSTFTRTVRIIRQTLNGFFTATPTSGCAPLTVQFQDQTPNSTTTAWCFNFNTSTNQCTGGVAMGKNVQFTFPAAGTYNVSMVVGDGCSVDTVYKLIQVNPSPVADFTFNNNVCLGDTTYFTASATIVGGSITGYQWNFGNGQSSILQNPAMRFDTAGTYNVCLTVTSFNGCTHTVCKPVTVQPKPDVQFTAQSACLNQQPIAFQNQTTLTSGTLTYTLWDFGDGNTSTLLNPQHTYAAPGTYTVTLIHGTQAGCYDTASQQITIHPIPTAAFTVTSVSQTVCGAPQTFNFTNQSAGAQGYLWDFDALGNPGFFTSTLANPTFTYTSTGLYRVRLITTNALGCSDTAEQDIIVSPLPIAKFSISDTSGCQPLQVVFTSLSTFPDSSLGYIVRWRYEFGDGTVQDGPSPNATHLYQQAGTYIARLIVETNLGCLDTFQFPVPIEVLPTPTAIFSWSIDDRGHVVFSNQSIHLPGQTTFTWQMGDGITIVADSVRYRYRVNRLLSDYTFTVCLTATHINGCSHDTCMPVFLPRLNLTVPNALAPDAPDAGQAGLFLPKGHSLREYELLIFDQWGNLVFRTDSLTPDRQPAEGWNGRHFNTGRELPSGTYVWKIRALFIDGTRWPGSDLENNSPDDKPHTSGYIYLIR
ncbi:PKD domain-containing protein [Thermaurantimonas aggregans]|uniref:PKD domain-containing protein n=1 Tax=Thermaurantimonas aggregans TaxID=2173829 RepID=UPI0023F3AD9F|nr:PKD domain-containing protein [Thermaurantimonas aggregans]MCX8149613.1 PKD domain-containing protein [Thermaurantimonas aggregans]